MKVIFSTMMVWWTMSIHAQQQYCSALESIFAYEPVKEAYMLARLNTWEIKVHDTSGLFQRCELKSVFGRKVCIEATSITLLDRIPCDFLIVVLKKSRRKLNLMLGYPTTGACFEFELKRKGKVFKVIRYWEMYT